MGCGREANGHAQKHYDDHHNHSIALHFNEKSCHCYECDEYVILDNQYKDLENIRECLRMIQNQEAPASHTRHGASFRKQQSLTR